jgi:hypothetical protein
LGVVDPATNTYYVTDRTNKSIDFLNLSNPLSNTVGQFTNKSFAGCNSGGESGGAINLPYIPMPGCTNIAITPGHTLVTNNDLDGPDGLDLVGSTLYVGDVNALWVMDKTTGKNIGAGKVAIPNTSYVDAGALAAGAKAQQGFRSDEGCFDPVNHLYATALTGDPNFPFYTILDTAAGQPLVNGVGVAENGTALPTIIGFVMMNDSSNHAAAGLEACAFDTRGFAAGTGFLWLNNDGSTANSHGEMDGIPIADLIAMKGLGANKGVVFNAPDLVNGAANSTDADTGPVPIPLPLFGATGPSPTVIGAAACRLGVGGGPCGSTPVKVIALPAKCDPTGLALGAVAGQVGAMCRPGTFNLSMDFQIVDTTTTPATITTVAGAGGGDQITYDAASKKWYLANSRGTANGKSCFNGSVQACNLVPTLTVVDGTTQKIVGQFNSGNNAHSVAVGGGYAVLPFTNTSAAGGGASFPNGGLALFPTF